MNKTLISGMFSSVSDAELVTEMLPVTDVTDSDENKDQSAENSKLEAEGKDNWRPNL